MNHPRLALAVLLPCASLGACLDTSGFDEPVAEQRHEQIMLNQMPLAAILLNTAIGTTENLYTLTSHPLRSDLFDVLLLSGDTYGLQLVEDEAQVFMKYLVRCALGPEDPKVEWQHPLDPAVTQIWSGELGLCSAWASAAPSSECLELVSACMLSAENAEGKSVAISLRGLDLAGAALPTDAEVTVKTLDDDGDEISSFGACLAVSAGSARDCGWSEEESLVGTCTPGGNVALQCAVGSSPGVIRVCQGHTGCNNGSTAKIAAHSSMCDTRSQITFTCPAGGSYAVMAGGLDSGDPVELDVIALTGQFPASELEVFDRREGAYFGSMLIPGQRATGVWAFVDSAGVVHRNVIDNTSMVVNLSMYACHDINFSDVDAYATHRLCAVVKDSEGDEATLCAAHSLGVCRDPALGPAQWICPVDDTAVSVGDGDFGDCAGRDHPITVFLDHPCDLAGPGIEGDECPGFEPWQP